MSIESVILSNHLILCCPLSSHLQSFPASGSFPVSQFFSSGGQNVGASASASFLLMNIQYWFPLGLTGLISLQSKGLWRVFSNTTVQKASILWCSAFFMVPLPWNPQQSHMVGITQQVTLSDCLISLSYMHLSFFHSFHGLVAYIFLVLNNILLSGHAKFIYSFTYWRTSWFFPSSDSCE